MEVPFVSNKLTGSYILCSIISATIKKDRVAIRTMPPQSTPFHNPSLTQRPSDSLRVTWQRVAIVSCRTTNDETKRRMSRHRNERIRTRPGRKAKGNKQNASTLARRAPPSKRPNHLFSSSRSVTHKIQLPAHADKNELGNFHIRMKTSTAPSSSTRRQALLKPTASP